MEIPASEVKLKLKNLRIYLRDPAGSEQTYAFADYLADQLKHTLISPEYFLLTVSQAFGDLARGTDIFSGGLISHHAVNRVPTVELFVRMDLRKIIDIIFPAYFAKEVLRVQEEVTREAENLKKIKTG